MTMIDNRAERTEPSRPIHAALLMMVPLLVVAANSSRAADAVRTIGSEKVLLIDQTYLAESNGVQLKLHPPRKTGERLLVSEHPWENATLNWFSVLQDGGKFRMWYECYDVPGWPTADDTSFCYAESTDGIHWTKPKLGLFSYQGSKENNILFRQVGQGNARSRVHGSCVFVDAAAPPEARYKAVSQGQFQGVGDRPYWIAGMTSADGLTWTRPGAPICLTFADSQYSGFWDPRLKQYVIYGRVGGHGRSLGRSSSDRFDKFAPLSLVLQTDGADPPQTDLYNPACMCLPGGIYLMCPSLYHHKADTLDIRLAVSRDGIHWSWPDRQTPLIALGKVGEFEGGSLYMANGCALVGEEIWFYYSGSALKHEETELDKLADPANRRVFSRAVAPRDRLISATAGAAGGSLLTPPVQFTGSRLQLIVAARPGGQVRVGLLDSAGQPIAGRALEDCRPLGDAAGPQTVAWKSGSDVSAHAAQPVRLRLELQNADLFGFQFVND